MKTFPRIAIALGLAAAFGATQLVTLVPATAASKMASTMGAKKSTMGGKKMVHVKGYNKMTKSGKMVHVKGYNRAKPGAKMGKKSTMGKMGGMMGAKKGKM